MTTDILLAPLLIPLVTAAVTLLLRGNILIQRIAGVAGVTAHLIAAILILQRAATGEILVLHVGEWQAPFGITLVADALGALMVLLTGLTGLATTIYSLATIDKPRERFGYYPLTHVLLMGVSGAFLTGDLFNLYVWFEVLLIASFVLLALGGGRGQMEGAIKYVALNLISSVMFLTAVGLLYGLTGTLNMADLAVRLSTSDSALVSPIAVLFLVSFGIKAGLFPLYFWLPASYHTPPIAVSALFAGLLTKVGVYALIRVFTLVFATESAFINPLLLTVSGLTMLTGVLGAAAHTEIRRILSFHIISQIGYMIMGLALATPLALAGSVFYIGHHIVVKTNLFLVGGVAHRLRGSYEIKKLGGLVETTPILGILFLIPALSLAGIPPLSGFWAKLILVRAGLEAQEYAIIAIALLVGALTLFSMIKIWSEAFWRAPPAADAGAHQRAPLTMLLPIAGLALITVLIGLFAGPLYDLATLSGTQLTQPRHYIEAVLGVQP